MLSMKKVHSLNKEISINTQSDIDSMITELAERVEFTCVGNSCGLDDVMYKVMKKSMEEELNGN